DKACWGTADAADSSLQSHLLSDEPDRPLRPVLGRTDPPPTDIRKSHSDLRRSRPRQGPGESRLNDGRKRFGIHCYKPPPPASCTIVAGALQAAKPQRRRQEA